ncbi:MAG: universal stress protein [Ectothiorhodospiraceae bacterium]|nr:universal stress protein [Ectothiorhodospiraceae bacterium]
MRTILLPFYDDPVAETALEQACTIATRFGGHVEGLFVMRPPQIIEAEGIALAGAYITQLKEEWRRRADRAKARFSERVAARGLTEQPLDEAADGATASWREVEGPEGQIIGDYGRLFDLIVIGRMSEQALIDWQVMCEAAFFESGRPCLVAAAQSGATIGERILIHWNASTEAAKAIAHGMPFLAAASKVLVVTVEGAVVPGPSGDQVATHLRRNGVPAEARTVTVGASTAGEVILAEAAAMEADLIIKGAYTQNRLRQLVFGGATRHILSEATIPVLMAR